MRTTSKYCEHSVIMSYVILMLFDCPENRRKSSLSDALYWLASLLDFAVATLTGPGSSC